MASDSDSQFNGFPIWAKIGTTLSAIAILSGLCVYLVLNLASNQNSNIEVFERLIEKFDKIIERHDDRQREWMRAHGDRISAESEKTRLTMTDTSQKTWRALDDMAARQDKSSQELSRQLETQTNVLKQIREQIKEDKKP